MTSIAPPPTAAPTRTNMDEIHVEESNKHTATSCQKKKQMIQIAIRT